MRFIINLLLKSILFSNLTAPISMNTWLVRTRDGFRSNSSFREACLEVNAHFCPESLNIYLL